MLVLRFVAAAHVSAGHAEAKVDPCVSGLQAVFASLRTRLHVADLIQMGARRGSAFLLARHDTKIARNDDQ
jgi:hypothetical protein